LTAVSAICLLGLAIWFSKTESLVAGATVCYRFASQLHPIQPRGPHSLFRGGFSVKWPLPLRFTASPRWEVTSRRSALFLPFFEEGRGTYFASASRVNSLRRLSSSRRLDFVACATFAVSEGGGFYHHRVGSQLASSTSYFVCHCFLRGTPSPVRLRLSVRGARLLPHRSVESTAHFSRLDPLGLGFFSRIAEMPCI